LRQILSFVASKLGETITAPIVSEVADELVGRILMLNLTVIDPDQLNYFYDNMYNTDLGRMGLESSAKYEILKRLVTFSNSLDKLGLTKEADYIDGIITKVHGKGPEYPVDIEEGDLQLIDDDLGPWNTLGEAFDAADRGEIQTQELGDFSNLEKTNISKDEAFSAGCSVCGDKTNSCGHHSSSYMAKPQLFKIQEYAAKLHDMIGEGEQLDDWMESYIAQIDQMIGAVYHKYSYKNKH